MNDGVAGHWITEGAGNEEITGAVLSSTMIVCEAVDELPQPSVDVHVLLTEYSCGHDPSVVTSWKESVAPLPQPSVLVAVAKDGIAGHCIVEVAGSGSITGAVTSITLIVCEAVDTLPQSSVAVHVLVIEYCPAQSPGVVTVFCVSVNGVPHASMAVATANEGVAGHCIVDGAGNAAITGAVTSRTVMAWDAVELLAHPSVAVHVRVTVKVPTHAPGVVTSWKLSVNALPQPSIAVAVAKDGVAGQSMMDGAGRLAITGALISCTLMT